MSQCSTATRGGKRRGKSRKMKGAGYGYEGGVVAVGAPVWGANSTSVAYTPSGGVDPKINDLYTGGKPDGAAMMGGRKSRKTRKSKKTRKTRKTRGRRRMRGGMYGANGGVVNAARAGYGFEAPDAGVRGGIAPVAGYNANVGGAPMTASGVRSV